MGAPLDRSATWPYDAAGEPGPYSYARAEQPNAVAVEASLGRSRGRPRTPLSRRDGGGHRRRPDDAAAGRHHRPRRGLLLRAQAAVRPHPALGRRGDRVRPDGGAAGGRRPDPARGAVEPDADDAGLRGRRRASGPRRVRRHARIAAAAAAARTGLRRLAAQRHQGAGGSRRPDRGRRHGQGRGALRSPPPHPSPDGADRLGRHRLVARARAEDARGAVRAHGGVGPHAGRPARRSIRPW